MNLIRLDIRTEGRRVVSSAPTCSSMAGAENVVLVQDHAVPSAWDRDLVRMAVLKGWEVG